MSRPARARIDLTAVRHNYRQAKALAPGVRALAIVKANAYGHGAVAVARALGNEADAFGVSCIEEAVELREANIGAPILLLEGVFEPRELPLVEAYNLATVVHRLEQLEWLVSARPARRLDVWLKMDSGMHRIGLAPEALRSAYQRLAECPHIGALVLMTHFARADELACTATREQIACFDRHVAGIPAPHSLANSAGLMAWSDARRDWVRPGIMLYGASPLAADHPASAGLRPTMYLESALISVRNLAAGEPVGYGARFVCPRPTRVGVVAIGYADGYPRHARDGTPIAVNGHSTRVIGRVSMDMLTLDLTELPEARPGDPVELWGGNIDVNAVATNSDTIAYQLFVGVSQRVPRHYEGTEI